MSLQDKYAALITAARQAASGEIKIAEQDSVLYIDGKVGSSKDKESLWNLYNQLDPDYRAGDLRLNIEVAEAPDMQEYTVKSGDSLSKIGAKFGVSWKAILRRINRSLKIPILSSRDGYLRFPQKNDLIFCGLKYIVYRCPSICISS